MGEEEVTEKKEVMTESKAEKNASNTISKEVTVQARVVRRVGYYDVYQGKARILKSTRYSELSRFHQDVMKEVPEFQGQLPRKTFLRHTNADFVESRRVDLQAYLRGITMDSRVSRTKVFESFFQAQN